MPRQRILIVEDEEHLLSFYCETLERAGYKTYTARAGREALEVFAKAAPDLVILDLGLIGEMDGFQVLSVLRVQRQSEVQVMILTAQAGETKAVQGFNLGADDYVLKPVSGDHLVARVRAQLRRGPTGERVQPSGIYHYPGLVIDLDRSQATRGGRRLTFGDTERRILARLLQTPGRPVTQGELMRLGWGHTEPVVKWTEAGPLLSCIYRLRDKLGRRLIETVPEVGFSISPSVEPEVNGRRKKRPLTKRR